MTVLNRVFLGTAIAIVVLDTALATLASSPGLFIFGSVLALFAVGLVLREHAGWQRRIRAHNDPDLRAEVHG
jgi:hypothetical protein